jgi:hypothetical protein
MRRDTGPRATAPALAAWIVSVPSLLLAVYVGAVSTIGWRAGDFNLAEAAIYGDAGEVERLIANGANPLALYPVRAFVTRRDDDLILSPMEAAIKEGRTALARLLLARGAVAGAAQAEQLRCLAAEEGRAEIADLLTAAYPDHQAPCRATERPW